MTIFILCQKRVLKTYQVKKEKKYPISDCKTVKPKQSCSKFIASPSPLQTKIVNCHRPIIGQNGPLASNLEIFGPKTLFV